MINRSSRLSVVMFCDRCRRYTRCGVSSLLSYWSKSRFYVRRGLPHFGECMECSAEGPICVECAKSGVLKIVEPPFAWVLFSHARDKRVDMVAAKRRETLEGEPSEAYVVAWDGDPEECGVSSPSDVPCERVRATWHEYPLCGECRPVPYGDRKVYEKTCKVCKRLLVAFYDAFLETDPYGVRFVPDSVTIHKETDVGFPIRGDSAPLNAARASRYRWWRKQHGFEELIGTDPQGEIPPFSSRMETRYVEGADGAVFLERTISYDDGVTEVHRFRVERVLEPFPTDIFLPPCQQGGYPKTGCPVYVRLPKNFTWRSSDEKHQDTE